MSDEHKPKHLRNLPPSVTPSAEEGRELMDLRTEVERGRRRRESERDPNAPEPWAFPVPRPMALLFDRLPATFTPQDAIDAGEALDLDAAAVKEALREMRERELVSATSDGFVKHPEAKNWF